MIHYGGGTGGELLAFAEQVRGSVLDRFGIELEMEPSVFGE